MAAQPPPQQHPKGQRQALDALWLAHLAAGGDPGDAHQLAGSSSFQTGITEFNQQRFTEAHESFEQTWRDAPYPDRLLPLALAKLAASWVQIGHGAQQEPSKAMRDATRLLLALPPTYARVDLAALLASLANYMGMHQQEPFEITLKR